MNRLVKDMQAATLSLAAALALGPCDRAAAADVAGQGSGSAAAAAEAIAPSRDRGLYPGEFPGAGVGASQATPGGATVTPQRPQAPTKKKAPAAPVASESGSPQVEVRKRPAASKAPAGGKQPGKAVTAVTPPRPAPAQPAAPVPAGSEIKPVAATTDSGAVIRARLNKTGLNPRYRVGENMEINVTASSDCNIAIFDFDGRGTLTQLYPNEYQQDSFLRAGESVVVGGVDSPFDFKVGGKGGQERIFVYAYPVNSKNPLTIAFSPPTNSAFRTSSISLDEYRELVKNAQVFFAREVKVVPKAGRPVSAQHGSAPNKVELSFVVEP